ncbi:MAG: hypothetical protein ACE5IK_10125 [Acidobacteriota bacterium]
MRQNTIHLASGVLFLCLAAAGPAHGRPDRAATPASGSRVLRDAAGRAAGNVAQPSSFRRLTTAVRPIAAGERMRHVRDRLGVWFLSDPRDRVDAVMAGAADERLRWQRDEPAFPGDRPGSLTARYEANLDAGLFGIELPHRFRHTDTFTAAAIFIIEPEGFAADPDGFFQISWGLWNEQVTGLERTGTPASFATDTFELMEFDYFPNVTPFGGPFLSPGLFGVATEADPAFAFLGAFTNFAFASQAATLPLGEPLMALMQHRPEANALVVSVHRIVAGHRLLPVPGAVTVIDLDSLPVRDYAVDTLGLTLWRDGFSGAPPSLSATVTFHALLFTAARLPDPAAILSVSPTRP